MQPSVHLLHAGRRNRTEAQVGDADVRDIYTSSTFLGVVVLKSTESDEYLFDVGTTGNRTVIWRGRVEIAEIPMAPISVRVLAEDYTVPVIFRIYEGDSPAPAALEVTLSSDKIRKLPVIRRGREWSFEIEAPANIISLEVGTSGRVR